MTLKVGIMSANWGAFAHLPATGLELGLYQDDEFEIRSSGSSISAKIDGGRRSPAASADCDGTGSGKPGVTSPPAAPFQAMRAVSTS